MQALKKKLLYYIEPKESCVMSFSAAMMNGASRISAVTEEDSLLLLLPTEQLSKWLKQFPSPNDLFYSQYNPRYSEMLDTINSLLFGKMDLRLYNYPAEKAKLKNTSVITITHKQIAAELGTARELITRVIKRLEQEEKIKQTATGIELLWRGDHGHLFSQQAGLDLHYKRCTYAKQTCQTHHHLHVVYCTGGRYCCNHSIR